MSRSIRLVEVRDPETDAVIVSRLTDVLGYVAFVDLAPGKYKVFVPDDARVTGKRAELVYVSAGAVARFAITPFAKGPSGPPVRAGDKARVRSDGGRPPAERRTLMKRRTRDLSRVRRAHLGRRSSRRASSFAPAMGRHLWSDVAPSCVQNAHLPSWIVNV